MSSIRQMTISIIKKPSAWLFILIIIFSFDRYKRWIDFDNGNFPFVHDVYEYYCYLPATFIHHDLSFNYPGSPAIPIENGNRIPRMTMGTSVMYAPFFFIARLIKGDYGSDGLSLPFKRCIHFGSILYSILGLWFCRKSLLKFFSETVTTLALFCIFFGTNLFYYTYGFGEMPHAYLFFIDAAFIYCSIQWIQNKTTGSLFWLSFLGGFATLVRPTEILIFLFPLLFGIASIPDLKQRFHLFFSYGWKIPIAFGLAVFPFFLQMLFWKMKTGHWFYFSYPDEKFFFSDPQIANFLFSFRKGWFVYTPMMLFAVTGIIFLRKYVPSMILFIVLFLSLDIYILSSWWAWSYGGSFGCRAMIQHYSFLAFPLAAFIATVFGLFQKKNILNLSVKIVLTILFLLISNFNYNQSWQYKYGIISHDSMTKESYFYILKHDEMGPKEIEELNSLMKVVPGSEMRKGNRD